MKKKTNNSISKWEGNWTDIYPEEINHTNMAKYQHYWLYEKCKWKPQCNPTNLTSTATKNIPKPNGIKQKVSREWQNLERICRNWNFLTQFGQLWNGIVLVSHKVKYIIIYQPAISSLSIYSWNWKADIGTTISTAALLTEASEWKWLKYPATEERY